jgi:hypothetical protein
MPTLALDEILDVLGDGDWHNITELETKIRIPIDKLMLSLAFLKQFGFIEEITDALDIPRKFKLSQPMTKWYVESSRR